MDKAQRPPKERRHRKPKPVNPELMDVFASINEYLEILVDSTSGQLPADARCANCRFLAKGNLCFRLPVPARSNSTLIPAVDEYWCGEWKRSRKEETEVADIQSNL